MLCACFGEARRQLFAYSENHHVQAMPVDFVLGVLNDDQVARVLWAKKFVVLLALHLSDAFLLSMAQQNPVARLRLFVVRLQQEFTRWLLTGNATAGPTAATGPRRGQARGDASVAVYQCTEHFVRSTSRLFLWL